MSITLTTPKKVSLNDVVVENNTQGADTTFDMDFLSNKATFTLRQGTVQGQPPNLNAGVYGDIVSVTLDMSTGNYQSTNGVSGTITPAQLSQFVTMMKNLRNGNESFVAATAIMPGTQVPW